MLGGGWEREAGGKTWGVQRYVLRGGWEREVGGGKTWGVQRYVLGGGWEWGRELG